MVFFIYLFICNYFEDAVSLHRFFKKMDEKKGVFVVIYGFEFRFMFTEFFNMFYKLKNVIRQSIRHSLTRNSLAKI